VDNSNTFLGEISTLVTVYPLIASLSWETETFSQFSDFGQLNLKMGIKGLSKVIADHAPTALKEMPIKSCFGRKVAIDASMSIYQFLIAVRQQDGMQLTNEAGDVTR
jgi:hypothetical protein